MKKMAVTWVDKNESFFKRTHNQGTLGKRDGTVILAREVTLKTSCDIGVTLAKVSGSK
jgi:hypothetical protein